MSRMHTTSDGCMGPDVDLAPHMTIKVHITIVLVVNLCSTVMTRMRIINRGHQTRSIQAVTYL